MQLADLIPLNAANEARISALERDRERQNGTLDRLEGKLDKLIFKIMAAVAAFGLATFGWILVLLTHA